MREITESQLRYISGAGGAPATSANAAGAAAIVGALAGIPGGPLGVVVGAVSAGLTTAIGSTVGSGSASKIYPFRLKEIEYPFISVFLCSTLY